MNRLATLLGTGLIAMLPFTALAQQGAMPSSERAQQGTVLVGSDSLVGSTVRNAEGVDVGKVSRLMIDPSDGRVVDIVVATGGKLGLGSNTISVPWNTVKVGQDNGKVIVVASQTLETAPKAERKETPPPASDSQPRR